MLIFFTAALLFSDAAWWVVEGISGLRLWNLLINVFRFIVTTMLIFYFWRYVVTALRLDGAYRRIADIIMNILLVPAVLACFANLFVPLYFSISVKQQIARCGGGVGTLHRELMKERLDAKYLVHLFGAGFKVALYASV